MISGEIKFAGLLSLHPKIFLLNELSKCFGLMGHKCLITHALVAAKILTAAYWKSSQLSTKLE